MSVSFGGIERRAGRGRNKHAVKSTLNSFYQRVADAIRPAQLTAFPEPVPEPVPEYVPELVAEADAKADAEHDSLRLRFVNLQFKPPNSASSTIILTGEMRSREREKVLLKVSLAPNRVDGIDNSLLVEIEIYRSIINEMYEGRITPHVAHTADTFRCNDFLRSLDECVDPETSENVRDQWREIVRTESSVWETNIFAANFLVFRLHDSVTLFEYMKTLALDTTEGEAKLVSILWQLAYTLHCFNRAQLRHNDLHSGNILVDVCSAESFSYVIDDRTAFTVPTNGVMVRIFDFDTSSGASVLRNTKLDNRLCEKSGACNGENPMQDIYSVVQFLYSRHLVKGFSQLRQDVESVIFASADSQALYTQTFTYPHIPCNLVPGADGFAVCAGEYPWRGQSLPTPETFIRNLGAFQRFRSEPLISDSTYFADASLRNRFTQLPRPSPHRFPQLSVQCLPDDQWMPEFANPGIQNENLVALTNLLAGKILEHFDVTSSDNRRFFNMIDELTEYLQHHSVMLGELDLVGLQFVQKIYGIDKKVLCQFTEFTPNEFVHSIWPVMGYKPETNSTIDRLFYCRHPHMNAHLKERFPEVVAMMADMYSDPETYSVSPEKRASYINNIFTHGDYSHTRYAAVSFGNIHKVTMRIHEIKPTYGL